jgi:hypothetical protein
LSLIREKHRIDSLIADAETFHWGLLNIDEGQLKGLEASADADVQKYARNLLKAMQAWKAVHDLDTAGALYELYAEGIALRELKQRAAVSGAFTVKRFNAPKDPDGKRPKAPDFECTCEFGVFYIEVKTPDIVEGVFATRRMMVEAAANNERLRKSLKRGVNVGEPQVISPHGEGASGKLHAELIDAYRGRIDNNMKKCQLTYGPTIVLVYDGRIGLDLKDATCLTPAYFDADAHPTPLYAGQCVTGDWWRVGFGRVGDTILAPPGFPGKSDLSGVLQSNGLLVDRPYLLGLAAMTGGRWQERDLKIFTLGQTNRAIVEDPALRFENMPPDAIASLFSDAYNDAADSVGGLYQVRAGRRPAAVPALKPKFERLFSVSEKVEPERVSLAQGFGTYLSTPSAIWRIAGNFDGYPSSVTVPEPGEIEGLYPWGTDFFLLKRDAGTHSLLRTTDEFRSFEAADDALVAAGPDGDYRLSPTQLQIDGDVMFINAGGGRNFLVSHDQAKSWDQLEGAWAAQVCSHGCFLVKERTVWLGGECPLDNAYLMEGILKRDRSGWARAPRSVAPSDLGNRMVQVIEDMPRAGVTFAGVEGGLLRRDLQNGRWEWSMRYEPDRGEDYPYIKYCVEQQRRGLLLAGGFNKAKDGAPFLALSDDYGISWVDVSGSVEGLGANMRQLSLIAVVPRDRIIIASSDVANGELVVAELTSL